MIGHYNNYRGFSSRRFPVLAVAIALTLLAGGESLAAQNEPAHGDGPTQPVPADAALSPLERLRRALAAEPMEPFRRYFAADEVHKSLCATLILSNPSKGLQQVQALQAQLKPDAVKPLPEAERRQLAAQAHELESLETRLNARLLVLQLGDPSYEKRQAAREELQHLGKLAVEELTWGRASADFEIATACLDLLVAIRGRGFIGISFSLVPPVETPAEAVELGLPFVGGVQIDSVLPDLPGGKAGLEKGDIIIQLGPLRIVRSGDLLRSVMILGPDCKTTIVVVRSGKIKTLPIQLAINNEMQ